MRACVLAKCTESLFLCCPRDVVRKTSTTSCTGHCPELTVLYETRVEIYALEVMGWGATGATESLGTVLVMGGTLMGSLQIGR